MFQVLLSSHVKGHFLWSFDPYYVHFIGTTRRRYLIIPLAFADLRQRSIEKALYIHANITAEGKATRNAALLCSSSEDFLLAWLGLMRLGFPVLLIAYDTPV